MNNNVRVHNGIQVDCYKQFFHIQNGNRNSQLNKYYNIRGKEVYFIMRMHLCFIHRDMYKIMESTLRASFNGWYRFVVLIRFIFSHFQLIHFPGLQNCGVHVYFFFPLRMPFELVKW